MTPGPSEAEDIQKAFILEDGENLTASGTFRKEFDNFQDGILELGDISNVVANLITGNSATEEEIIQTLAMNVYNAQGTEKPIISIQNGSVVYWSKEGLGFGWSKEESINTNNWRFILMHPKGSNMSLDSTLWKNAVKKGWVPEIFDRRTASTFSIKKDN